MPNGKKTPQFNKDVKDVQTRQQEAFAEIRRTQKLYKEFVALGEHTTREQNISETHTLESTNILSKTILLFQESDLFNLMPNGFKERFMNFSGKVIQASQKLGALKQKVADEIPTEKIKKILDDSLDHLKAAGEDVVQLADHARKEISKKTLNPEAKQGYKKCMQFVTRTLLKTLRSFGAQTKKAIKQLEPPKIQRQEDAQYETRGERKRSYDDMFRDTQKLIANSWLGEVLPIAKEFEVPSTVNFKEVGPDAIGDRIISFESSPTFQNTPVDFQAEFRNVTSATLGSLMKVKNLSTQFTQGLPEETIEKTAENTQESIGTAKNGLVGLAKMAHNKISDASKEVRQDLKACMKFATGICLELLTIYNKLDIDVMAVKDLDQVLGKNKRQVRRG